MFLILSCFSEIVYGIGIFVSFHDFVISLKHHGTLSCYKDFIIFIFKPTDLPIFKNILPAQHNIK